MTDVGPHVKGGRSLTMRSPEQSRRDDDLNVRGEIRRRPPKSARVPGLQNLQSLYTGATGLSRLKGNG